MRRAAALSAVAAVVCGIAASASGGLPTPPVLAVMLGPPHAGARPVTLTLVLTPYPLLCGRPSGSLVVMLPPEAQVPAKIAASAVRIDAAVAGRVTVRGHEITVAAAPPKGPTCLVITEGRLTVVFTPGAALGNPANPGIYQLTVRHGALRFRSPLEIVR